MTLLNQQRRIEKSNHRFWLYNLGEMWMWIWTLYHAFSLKGRSANLLSGLNCQAEWFKRGHRFFTMNQREETMLCMPGGLGASGINRVLSLSVLVWKVKALWKVQALCLWWRRWSPLCLPPQKYPGQNCVSTDWTFLDTLVCVSYRAVFFFVFHRTWNESDGQRTTEERQPQLE